MSRTFSTVEIVISRRLRTALCAVKLLRTLKRIKAAGVLPVIALGAMVALVSVNVVVAQSPEDYQNVVPGPYHQTVAPFPVEFGFTQHHSSTALEGALRGKAAVIQALGSFELSDSQARILREQARWLDRENDLAQTETLLIQKQLWSEARRQERTERTKRVETGKVTLATRRATIHRVAYGLAATELDRATGEINWPVVLAADEFRRERARIEELFRKHVSYDDPQSATAREIGQTIDDFSRQLREHIGALPRGEYYAAQKFLRGLKCEAEALAAS